MGAAATNRLRPARPGRRYGSVREARGIPGCCEITAALPSATVMEFLNDPGNDWHLTSPDGTLSLCGGR